MSIECEREIVANVSMHPTNRHLHAEKLSNKIENMTKNRKRHERNIIRDGTYFTHVGEKRGGDNCAEEIVARIPRVERWSRAFASRLWFSAAKWRGC